MPHDRREQAFVKRLLSVRIVKWYFKLLYAAGVWFAGYPVIALFTLLGAPSIVGSVANVLVTLAGIVLGARLFRGREEPVGPARPWWQMTARRKLSRVIGILAVLTVVLLLFGILGAALGVERLVASMQRLTLPETILSIVDASILAFLYLNSAAHLPKHPPRSREPEFKPRVMLR